MAVIQLKKGRILCFHPHGPMMRPDAHLCREAFEQFQVASVRTSWQHVQTLFRVRKYSSFPLQTRIGKTVCIRPDDRATSSEHGLNMETLEARYEKVVAQLTIWTLYASVGMRPRIIRDKLFLGLLSL
jgi:hypothetical protein